MPNIFPCLVISRFTYYHYVCGRHQTHVNQLDQGYPEIFLHTMEGRIHETPHRFDPGPDIP